MKKNIISALLILSLLVALCAGCTTAETPADEGQTADTSSPAPESSAPAESAAPPEPSEAPPAQEEEELPPESEEYQLPLTTGGESLTMWAISNSNVTNAIGELNNHQIYKKAEEVTGVKVDITTVQQESSSEKFSILLASGDYPDMIRSGQFPNGIASARDEEIILDLTDIISLYAQNYNKIMTDNPTVAKDAKMDDGSILQFYMLNANGDTFDVPALDGPVIRKDLLDKLGKDVPENLDELYDVLKAFKSEFDLDDPLYLGRSALEAGFIMSAFDTVALTTGFGASPGMIKIDNVVKFGPAQPGFKEYLELMANWFSEGILNSEFYYYDDNPMSSVTEAKKTEGDIGLFSAPGSNLKTYCSDKAYYVGMTSMPNADGENHLAGMSIIVDTGKGMTITSGCENVELAARWCDFWYSDVGRLLSNYGLEGETFEYVDGKPQWLPILTNNPDGMSLGIARQIYTTLTQQPGVCPKDIEISLMDENALEAVEIWNSFGDSEYTMPTVSLTAEESARSAQLLADISTLSEEVCNKILMGDESIDAYDNFIKEANSLGIDEVIAIYQGALDRYNNR